MPGNTTSQSKPSRTRSDALIRLGKPGRGLEERQTEMWELPTNCCETWKKLPLLRWTDHQVRVQPLRSLFPLLQCHGRNARGVEVKLGSEVADVAAFAALGPEVGVGGNLCGRLVVFLRGRYHSWRSIIFGKFINYTYSYGFCVIIAEQWYTDKIHTCSCIRVCFTRWSFVLVCKVEQIIQRRCVLLVAVDRQLRATTSKGLLADVLLMNRRPLRVVVDRLDVFPR